MSISHAGCPACGGPLTVVDGDRRISCPWCEADLLLYAPEHTLRWLAPNVLSAQQVRAAASRTLTRPEIPESAKAAALRAVPHLYYAPFFELDGKLLGRIKVQTGVRKERGGRVDRQPDGSVRYLDSDDREITQAEYYKVKQVAEFDTRIRMHEIYMTAPAIRLGNWGLQEAQLGQLRQGGLAVEPFDPVRAQSEASILDPDLTPESLLKQLEDTRDTSTADWDVSLGEHRIQLIYLPIWRLRYRHDGRSYALSLSGIDGAALGGSAPEDHARGALAMILAGACVGLPLEEILTHAGLLLSNLPILFHPISLLVESTVMFFLLSGLAYAWSEFRYRGEVRFARDRVWVEKLNIPPKTALDKLVDWMSERINAFARETMRQQERGL